MSRDDPYSRVYHKLADEYPHVYDDDRAFALFCRLLMGADAAWPLRLAIPATANRKSLSVLEGCGLIVVDRGRYTVRGLDAERNRRRDAGRIGAAVRWHSERNADGNSKPMPSRAEHRQDEPRLNETVRDGAGARPLGLVKPDGKRR